MTQHPSLAARAKATADAEAKAQRLREEARVTVEQAKAYDVIARAAEFFALNPQSSDVRGEGSSRFRTYHYEVEVTPDATLHFKWDPRGNSGVGELTRRLKPSDQLYYDLDPEYQTLAEYREKTSNRGYTYGCYELRYLGECGSLATLGRQLALIESARERWQKKYGV